MFSAIFFDLDNTLWDDAGASRRAVAMTCRHLLQHAPHLAELPLEETYVHTSTALWTDDPVRLAAPVRFMRRRAWSEALALVGGDIALADDAVEFYAAARRQTYALYPESLPLLRALRGRVRLALITNGPAELQREKIAAMGLAAEMDDIFIAGEVGISKPHPDIFHLALHRAGCRPSQTLMIGDSWEKDILPARAMGMQAMWINPEVPADAGTLPHIRDLAGSGLLGMESWHTSASSS